MSTQHMECTSLNVSECYPIVNAMFHLKMSDFFSQQLYLQAADSLSKIRVYYKATLDNVMGKEGPRVSTGGPQRDRSQEWRQSLFRQGHVVSYS